MDISQSSFLGHRGTRDLAKAYHSNHSISESDRYHRFDSGKDVSINKHGDVSKDASILGSSQYLNDGSRTSSSEFRFNLEGRSSNASSTIQQQGVGQLFMPRSLTSTESMTTTATQYLPRIQQLPQQSFLDPALIAAANLNNNAPETARGGGGGGGVVFTSTGVEGRAAPMRPGEGDCSVMVAAQNLMANYIPVFNPKGAMVDMYGPPHGQLEQNRYAEKIKGWGEAVESREGGRSGGGGGGVAAGDMASGAPGNAQLNANANNAFRRRLGGENNDLARKADFAEEERRGWQALAAAASVAAERKARREGLKRGDGGNGGGGKSAAAYLQASALFRSPRGANRNNANRPNANSSAANHNNNQGEEAIYDDNLGECLDFIDDEYKDARENAKQYHKSLTKIFETLKSSLKPGPPIGSRWDAFKNAFKTGSVARCPELKLAKQFDSYQQALVNPGSPLEESVSKMSQVFGLMCSAKEALEHDIKSIFLNPLYVFLDKEWKDLVTHDKAVQSLATSIQKAKAENRDHEAIADLMDLFKHERSKTLYLFNYILSSDYSQILKFIDLTQCYIDHHKENLDLLENLMRILRHRANLAKPEETLPNKSEPLGHAHGCLGTCTVPCVMAPGLVTDTRADTRDVEMEMQRIYGAKLPQRPADCGSHGKGQTCDPTGAQASSEETPVASKSSCGDEGSAAFLKYMENRIKTRPYGFVKEAFDGAKPGELPLHLGEIVYLKGKPGFDKYCGEKDDGAKGTFPQNKLDVIVDIC